MNSTAWHDETALIHGGLDRSHYGETAEALYLTSGFVYESAEQAEARFKGEDAGFIYSRYGNPTVGLFERRMAELEGTETCFATASGMAAVFSSLACQLEAGDHIVASRVLFGSCLQVVTSILPKFGIEYSLVDGADLKAWQQAIKPNTKLFFCESPANPTLSLVDIAGLAALAKQADARLVVDNAFASPAVQNAKALGADIVIYSATKHIDGQGRCLGGAICCSDAFFKEKLQPFVRHTGPAMSPFNAWVLAKSLETLGLRVDRMSSSACSIAKALGQLPFVEQVAYPGCASHPQHALAETQMKSGGSLLTFKVVGDKAATFRLMNCLNLIKISNNLGDSKSLITHPATTTHRTLAGEDREVCGITDNLLRLSVGLEAAEDLVSDLEQAGS